MSSPQSPPWSLFLKHQKIDTVLFLHVHKSTQTARAHTKQNKTKHHSPPFQSIQSSLLIMWSRFTETLPWFRNNKVVLHTHERFAAAHSWLMWGLCGYALIAVPRQPVPFLLNMVLYPVKKSPLSTLSGKRENRFGFFLFQMFISRGHEWWLVMRFEVVL